MLIAEKNRKKVEKRVLGVTSVFQDNFFSQKQRCRSNSTKFAEKWTFRMCQG